MQRKTKIYTVGTLAAAVAFTVAVAVNELPWSKPAAALPVTEAPPQSNGLQFNGLPDFVPLVKKNADAVVNISSEREVQSETMPSMPGMPDFPDQGPLKDWMKHFFEFPHGFPHPHGGAMHSLGSGFIISPDGYILTNEHVVDGAKEVTVRLNDKRELKAKVVGMDELSDVALLKVDARNLPTVEIGDAKALQVGQWVLAIGSPFGFDHSASQGIVSALGRSLPDDTYVPLIQTDVPLNPGNSGGPLIDLSGKVVGVNSQIYSKSGGYMGVSFSIPIDVAMNVVDQIKANGHVTRGWLGVTIQDMTQDLASSFGLAKPEGALIAEVVKDGPADHAGLKTGDVILSYNGRAVLGSGDLPPLVAATPPGRGTPIEILSHGNRHTVTVTIAKLPEDEVQHLARAAEAAPSRLNLSVEDLSAAERKQLGISGGVRVVDVGPGPAQSAGVEAGDIILSIDSERVTGSEQLKELVDKLPSGRPVPLLVKRDKGTLFLAIKPGGEG
jgi:serine protease Do